ncbi:LysR family transcriptional regulator [Streptomyces sp. NPDC004610]|uniref:LysR family transcriptional regulator n=1 Tax=unclassified Streptomyces TaxID=2593676 RepID=UPI0033ACAF65
MELRQLEYFVAVAEERNFTRAAERVHISQSGVSAQIRQLERELGAELFDRSGRTATLTPAGKAALEHARTALAASAAVGVAVAEVSGVLRGRLTAGMVIGCTITPLFEGLAAFHRAHPGVEIELLEDNSERLVERVRAGGVDLALVGTASAPPRELESLVLVSERLMVAVPPDHPLAARPGVTLAEVSAHPLICMPPGTGVRTAFDRACASAGLAPAVTLQAGAADALAELAARGLGVAVLSESLAAPYADRLTARPIEDAPAPALLSLTWRDTTRNPALAAALTHLGRAFGTPTP